MADVETVKGRFPNAAAVRAYARAGRATLTLQSGRTGAHYTYRIQRARRADSRNGPRPLYVSVMTGGAEEYSYLGVLADTGFCATKGCELPVAAPQVRAFAWFWESIAADRVPKDLDVRHCGRCGVCQRTLTHPTSLDTGIGPECSRRLACTGA